MSFRSGIGYDVHAFSGNADRPLRLGGVLLPGEQGLGGHSDADVLLHAIIDGMLGAAALGDLGDHFPPGDERWRNASSRDLLIRAMSLLPSGLSLVNIDTTIVAERPKIAPHREAMRTSIAEITGLVPGRVSVKATTNEGLGALGRAEGIAAFAVVLLEERA